MKKIIKTFLTTLLIIVLFSNNTTIYAEASESSNITPRWSNANSISTNFVASSSGGKVSINYIGYSDSFSRAEVSRSDLTHSVGTFIELLNREIVECSVAETTDSSNYYNAKDESNVHIHFSLY